MLIFFNALLFQDCQVFIWTNDSDSSGSTWSPKLLHKFNDVVWHLSWSVTGNILAVSGGDNKVRAAFNDFITRISWKGIKCMMFSHV